MRGRFVVLEGMDGTGKTTQARRLVARLAAAGGRPLHLREPGGTPVGERLRDLLLAGGRRLGPRTEALLFFAARAELLRSVAGPALAGGRDVICERFSASTLAYQGQAEGDADFVLSLDRLVVPEDLQPDLVLILDLEPGAALARAGSRGAPDGFEVRGLEFQEAVREGYRRYAAERPERSVVLDVTGCSEDEIEARLWREVEARSTAGP